MTLGQQRREATEAITADMIKLFDESGVEYTCQAAIHSVVKTEIEKRCADLPALSIRPRMILNRVCDTIHNRRYPKGR